MIGTSINIETGRLEKLRLAVKKIRISENELLSILLMKSRRVFGDIAVTGRTVEYQRNIDESDFIIHHITIRETDYEFATGRRYIFKISVSYIFRIAIDLFLSEIIYEWTKKRTQAEQVLNNYRTNLCYKDFNIDHFFYCSAEFWVIPWPREKEATQ